MCEGVGQSAQEKELLHLLGKYSSDNSLAQKFTKWMLNLGKWVRFPTKGKMIQIHENNQLHDLGESYSTSLISESSFVKWEKRKLNHMIFKLPVLHFNKRRWESIRILWPLQRRKDALSQVIALHSYLSYPEYKCRQCKYFFLMMMNEIIIWSITASVS